ncbi:MAG: hypothetical protein V2B18_22870 [Pseudomonadota bacterium]
MVTDFQYPPGDEDKPFVRQPGARTFWPCLGLVALCATSFLWVPRIVYDPARPEMPFVLRALCCVIAVITLLIALNRGSSFGEVWIIHTSKKDLHVYRTSTTYMPGAYVRYLNGGHLTRLLCPERRTRLGNTEGFWTITGIRGPTRKASYWGSSAGFFQSIRLRIRDYLGGEISWLTLQEVLKMTSTHETVTGYRTHVSLQAMAHDYLGTSLCAIELSHSSGLARNLAVAALTEWERRFSRTGSRPDWEGQAAEVLAELMRQVEKAKAAKVGAVNPGTIACETTVI